MRQTAVKSLVIVGSALAGAGALHAWWNSRVLRDPLTVPITSMLSQRVSVLVPARNEEEDIGACLDAILAQQGLDDWAVTVLDDNSSDATPEILKDYSQRFPRLEVITSLGEPPSGWLGKNWACHRLALRALDQEADVLAFVDADVVLRPDALVRTIATMDDANLSVACPYPRQIATTVVQRLVQPLLQWSWLTTLPLGVAERSRRPSLAAGNGQFLVVKAQAYQAAGGHEEINDQVLEDIALVRNVKTTGGFGGVIDGTLIATCHMYRSDRALIEGYRKSLWAAFGPPASAALAVGAINLAFTIPAIAMLTATDPRLRIIAAGGYAAGVASRVVAARRTGGRAFPDALAHPVSIVMFSAMVASSWHGRTTGSLQWSGRTVVT